MTIQDDMLAADSAERAKAGLPPRTIDPALAATAQELAEMFVAGGSFSHSIGGGMQFRAERNGWRGNVLAENIAEGFPTVAGTFDQWMRSPGHARNILDRSTNLAGFGHAVSRNGTHYWAADYGSKGTGGGETGGAVTRGRGWLAWLWGVLGR